jgi:hypothetical protein
MSQALLDAIRAESKPGRPTMPGSAGAIDPCEHVIAAAITGAGRHRGRDYRADVDPPGLPLQARRARAHRHARAPALRRTTPLPGSLQSMIANGEARNLQVENGDLLADRVLERPWRGALAPERLEGQLGLLECPPRRSLGSSAAPGLRTARRAVTHRAPRGHRPAVALNPVRCRKHRSRLVF